MILTFISLDFFHPKSTSNC